MAETGQSWRLTFDGHPAEARQVREWTRARVSHPHAPHVANELFVSVLTSGSPAAEMTLSTAGLRTRIVATGAVDLCFPLLGHGPGLFLVCALSSQHGVTPDGRGIWALLTAREPAADGTPSGWTGHPGPRQSRPP